MIPDLVLRPEADEPAEGQMLLDLLHQPAFAKDHGEAHQPSQPQLPLWWNRIPVQ
jgi:hypothetical protein